MEASTSVSGPPGRISGRKRILLAEDDFNLRSFLLSILTRDGYDVVEAKDGEELGDYLAKYFLRHDGPVPVDLIVTDVRMPGLSGLEVLEEFRRAGLATPVILMTAFGSEQLHAEARRLGAAASLDKPFEIDDLLMLVRLLVPHADSGLLVLSSSSASETAKRTEDAVD